MYELDASGVVAAPLPRVWRILTNYERMTEFVPDLQPGRIRLRCLRAHLRGGHT